MKKEKTYRPVDLYTMFDISKSTLFRWEKDKDCPPVERDEDGERRYTQAHVHWLGAKKFARIKRQYQIAIKNEDLARMEELHRLMTKYKVLYLENSTGFEELQHQELSPETIKALLLEATEYDPGDEAFKKIITAVYNQTMGED